MSCGLIFMRSPVQRTIFKQRLAKSRASQITNKTLFQSNPRRSSFLLSLYAAIHIVVDIFIVIAFTIVLLHCCFCWVYSGIYVYFLIKYPGYWNSEYHFSITEQTMIVIYIYVRHASSVRISTIVSPTNLFFKIFMKWINACFGGYLIPTDKKIM